MADDTLDRRALFHAGAALAIGAALPACGRRDEPKMAPPHDDRSAPTAPVAPTAAAPGAELIELDFAGLAARMASGADTAKSLVTKYKERIAALNEKGPGLRAVLEVNPEAETIAAQLDDERKAGKLRGPLHGLPILVKDNVDTGDQQATTAGSLALDGARAAKDAFVVGKLRAAGAVILGKTNLSEWANFRGQASSSGWSGRGGQCRNPYALDRTPSGSSSGSGSATAASLCAGAIGSETDGSIVSPSSCNGLVGVKPTVGLVSRAGVVPLSSSQDTLGPMTRTVADAAALLTAIAGPDPADPTTTAPHKLRPAAPVDYRKALDGKALAGARIGVPRKGFFGVNRNVDALMVAVLAKLSELGAVLVDPVDLETPPDLGPAEIEVLVAEMKVHLDAYLAGRADAKVHSIADVIAFNKAHADRELAIFGQEYFEQAAAKTGGLADKAYVAARAKCVQVAQLIDKAMADHKLDAFVTATNSPAWLIDPVNGDSGGFSNSTLPAVAGYPHVTLPAGHVHGLPVGVSFFGAAFSEAKLLGYAFAFEQATKHRKAPRYLPTVELA